MPANNLITIPVYCPINLTVRAKDTYHNLQIDLKTSKIEIPKDAVAEVAWIAMMNGSGFAEVIWSINSIQPDFVVSLFVSNPSDHAVTLSGPASQDGHLLMTFVVLYDLPKKPKAKKATV